MAMVATPTPAEGPQAAFTYSSEPQAVPPKRSARSNYGGNGNATTPDAAQWMDENEVCLLSQSDTKETVSSIIPQVLLYNTVVAYCRALYE